MINKEKVESVKHYEEGLKLYRAKKFKEAIESFNRSLSFVPGDVASKTFIERCEHFIIEPPSADWDGVYEMKSK